MTLIVLIGSLVLKTKQNQWQVAVIDSGFTLSCVYLSQKIINNVPRKG